MILGPSCHIRECNIHGAVRLINLINGSHDDYKYDKASQQGWRKTWQAIGLQPEMQMQIRIRHCKEAIQ